MEQGILERSIQAFRIEIANRIVRTVDTKEVNKEIENLEFYQDKKEKSPDGNSNDGDQYKHLN